MSLFDNRKNSCICIVYDKGVITNELCLNGIEIEKSKKMADMLYFKNLTNLLKYPFNLRFEIVFSTQDG